MPDLTGYRTLIVNALMLLVGIGSLWGFNIPADSIDKLATGIIALMTIVNVIMRMITTTPFGKKPGG